MKRDLLKEAFDAGRGFQSDFERDGTGLYPDFESWYKSKAENLPISDVGRSLPTDEEINDMVMWLDKRCGFDDHQKDYVFFGLKQMAKKVIGQ